MHFYCSNHRTIFCRECIQVDHTNERCFVVDLYEIEKMRKLQSQNISLNKGQLAKRKDGATVSCIVAEIPKPPLKAVPNKDEENEYACASASQNLQQYNVQPMHDYGNEGDLTNEGDNTAEIYAPPKQKMLNDNWKAQHIIEHQQSKFQQQQDDYDEEDEEEGEFIPQYDGEGAGGMEDIANYQEMLRVHQMMKMAEQ